MFSGDEADAEIKIVAFDYFAGLLAEGMEFDFREGPIEIGKGVIRQILNENLKNSNRQHCPLVMPRLRLTCFAGP